MWILCRLLALILAVHSVFALFGIRSVIGYPFVGVIALLMLIEPTGFFGILVSGIGRIMYEWIFWLPSRRQLILRNRKRPKDTAKHDLTGAEAIVVRDLTPAGTVAVHGIHRPARTNFGFIAKGERVVIESSGDFELRVRAVVSRPTEPPRT
jgi:membrane-bound ClpP family serine protease